MRLAIAHEWLDARCGSEKTFEAIARAFPDADLFALTRDLAVRFDLGGRAVRTTFLDRFGSLRRRRDVLLPLMTVAWRRATRREYDVVITSSHAFAKWFGPAKDAIHLCYCYTPARYLWMEDVDDRRVPRGALTRSAVAHYRRLDYRSAGWVDSFAAISTAVRDRVGSFYGRDARVIHPPVDNTFFSWDRDEQRGDYVLAFSRFIAYKRLDVAIEAAAIAGVDLVVAGSGPQETTLRRLAAQRHPGRVRFEINPSDAALRSLYRRARALVFPALEDFGIVPVEAQACGTPVVALAAGGSLDTVRPGETGVLVADQDAAAFAKGLREVLDAQFDPADCVAHAERFSHERFSREIREWFAGATSSPAPEPSTAVVR